MKKGILFFLLVTLPFLSDAQFYKRAFGIKVGTPGQAGFNAKIYLNEKLALDNLLGLSFDPDHRFVSLQSIFEYNKKFGMNPGYNWYAGAGPTAMYYIHGGYLQSTGELAGEKLFFRGDAVLGLEYTAPKTKFNASLEVGPAIMFYPVFNVGLLINVGVRYVFRDMFK